MNETFKLGTILLIITAVAGGVLAFTNEFTAPIIEEIRMEATLGALMEIFPNAEDVETVEEALLEEVRESFGNVREISIILEGGETLGYAFKTVSGGYGGDIVTLTGIYVDGTIAGIQVVENSETPGLGTVIEDEKYTSTYVGKSTENELVNVENPSADNEVLLISGATVSTVGVTRGVNAAREAFLEYFSN